MIGAPTTILAMRLTSDEERALLELSAQQDTTPEVVLRCALRLYQLHIVRVSQGCTCQWRDRDGSPMDVAHGCPALD